MSIQIRIICDGCGKQGDSFVLPRRPHHARLALSDDGWTVGLQGGRDYCESCSDDCERGEPAAP